ncbi:MAG: hypothetical protein JXR58_02660, partial [Bacteroidales bacterium]|nr:hypothetical protein [Bacteroidales bacterium]
TRLQKKNLVQGKRILVCPLDWGLGHATRLIPIINSLIENNCEVILGGSGNSIFLLKNRFPSLQIVEIPSLEIKYNKGKNQVYKLLCSLPKFLKSVRNENIVLNRLVNEISPDLIISDNRYGLYNKTVDSIIITHQLYPVLPKAIEYLAHLYISSKIRKFKYCLIPDNTEDVKLTGLLSQKRLLPENALFIGFLSRFGDYEKPAIIENEYDFLVILSGPEPQRSILEKKIVEQIENFGFKAAILQAKPQEKASANFGNIHFFNHVSDEDFLKLVNKSSNIIARAGYSTIMDLIALRRNAILIPTPGQTEQEYFAKTLESLNYFVFVNQEEINLKMQINSLKRLSRITDDFQFFKDFGSLKISL